MKKIKVCVVVGPTASGKSDFAVEIAKKYNGEIISGDSMQIYKEMNIGTAKPSLKQMQGIRHHLIGMVSVTENFSVARFVDLAQKCVNEITCRGKLPIICGGTGLYIDSLINGLDFSENEVDLDLRKSLKDRVIKEGIAKIYDELKEIDPEYAALVHPNNEKKVIRALEFYMTSGITMSEQKRISQQSGPRYDANMIGLTYKDRQILYQRINNRVDDMMKNGLLDEARNLYKLKLSDTARGAIGYKEMFEYFDKKCDLEDAIENIKRASRRYAKRQLTWFNRNKKIKWIYKDECSLEDLV